MQAKRLILVLLALLMCIVLPACSSRQTRDAALLDPDTVAQAIIDNVDFQAELTKADAGAAANYYDLDGVTEDYAIYMNGATVPVEEVAVLKAADSDDKQAQAAVEKRLEDLKYQFADYHPEELTKINNPVIVSKGNVIVLVLTDDTDNARQVIEELLED